MAALKAPFPYFGGKSRIADLVWSRFGDTPNYVEPFCGSCAVLLARPHDGIRTETVNDMNAWLANVWRAVSRDPDAVAEYASDPVSELDLHARGDWMFYRPGVDVEFVEKVRSDPDWYDPKSAGWWVWGQSSWIGSNWGVRNCRSRPHLGAGRGVNRQLPHLGNAGMGVNRQLAGGDVGDGITDTTRKAAIREYLRQLCERLCRVRVCCGDWTRVLGPCVTTKHGTTAVFLDPPYSADRDEGCYGEHDSMTVSHDVRAWAIEHGEDPLFRIALCGYEGEHDMPDAWEKVAWKTVGGYGSYGRADSRGKANKHLERVWFSPWCLREDDGELFV